MSEKVGGFASRVGDFSGWFGKKYKGEQVVSWDHDKQVGSVFFASGIDQSPDRGYDWKKVGGFIVRDYEMAVILQNGKYVGDLAAGMYKLEKKMKTPGCEIIWLSKEEFKILWGTGNVYAADNLMIGGHGIVNVRISSPRDFVTNLLPSARKELLKGNSLENWIKESVIESINQGMALFSVEELVRDRTGLEDTIKDNLGGNFTRWGLEFLSCNVGGIKVPEEYRKTVLEYEARADMKKKKKELESDEYKRIKEQKAKYEDMLVKIDDKLLEGTIPVATADKLRADYETKLDKIKQQLAEFE
ncbi:MAG: SPFH domain-containing protein [Candidatus Hodarchaeales archaeon]|jgi:membrane protease subunit (stomatin/prohibitin family)